MSNNSKDLLANSVHSDQYYALQVIGIIVIAAFSKVVGVLFLKNISTIILCMLGTFTCFLSSINYFQKYHQSVKQYGSRSGLTFVKPELCRGYQQVTPLAEHVFKAVG